MDIKDSNNSWHMPSAYLKVILQHLAAEHQAVDLLLDGTDLNLEKMLKSDIAVSFAQTRKVLANATKTLGPGWHTSLAGGLTISSHGPLGFATVTAPDIRTSVGVLLRFVGIRAPFVWLASSIEAGSIKGDKFVIRLYESIDMGQERTTLVELVMIALQGLLERPLGREIHQAHISFAHPPPVYHQQLEMVFHPQVSFNASGHTLSFPVAWLDEPCVLFDEAMHRYLVARCEEELSTASGVLPAGIAIRQALLAQPDKLPSLAEIASSQHVSSRTLIRRLKRGNTSYSAILEEVRRTLAVDFLLNTEMSVASIAYRLGYQDPSNFGRAFRNWFDDSPASFRASLRLGRTELN